MVVVVVVDLDGDGDVNLADSCVDACTSSTLAGYVHVAVAVKVHDHDHDYDYDYANVGRDGMRRGSYCTIFIATASPAPPFPKLFPAFPISTRVLLAISTRPCPAATAP
jgi:hypothetical protein